MLASSRLCLILVTTGICISTDALRFQNDEKEPLNAYTKVTKASAPRTVTKRSIYAVGAALLGKVFLGAKHLYDNGRDIIYIKKGGIKKARDDFDSLNPTHVKYIWKGNVISRIGELGHWNVVLRTTGLKDTPTLTVYPVEYKAKTVELFARKTIVYKD